LLRSLESLCKCSNFPYCHLLLCRRVVCGVQSDGRFERDDLILEEWLAQLLMLQSIGGRQEQK
jgi:hypothetical protein